MSTERWNPFRDFDNMRQAMDRWMDERMPGNFLNQQSNMLSVALDVHETDQGYELEASLPGVKPEDVDINVERDTVTIRGQTRSTGEQREARNFLYRERRSGSFYRVLRLPDAIDGEKVEATLENGILTVQLPKLAQTSQRRIQVRSQGQGSSLPGGSSVTPKGPAQPGAIQRHDPGPADNNRGAHQDDENRVPGPATPGTDQDQSSTGNYSDYGNPS